VDINRESRRLWAQKELFGFSRLEALYHKRIITRNVIIVKRYYWVFKNPTKSRDPQVPMSYASSHAFGVTLLEGKACSSRPKAAPQAERSSSEAVIVSLMARPDGERNEVKAFHYVPLDSRLKAAPQT